MVRRAAQAALAVLAAALVAGTAGHELPFAGGTLALGIAPADSVGHVAFALRGALLGTPLLLAAAFALAAAAAALPYVRTRSRYGLGALGLAVTIGSVVAGVGAASIPLVAAVWGVAAVLAARAPR
jgi:hypothetical protein